MNNFGESRKKQISGSTENETTPGIKSETKKRIRTKLDCDTAPKQAEACWEAPPGSQQRD